MRILHLITALNVGGAETMLAKLIEEERRAGAENQITVMSLMRPGAAGDRIRRAGVRLTSCELENFLDLPLGLARLVREIRAARPDVIVAWMYHAQLAATFAAFAARRRVRIIWNVRHSLHDLEHERPVTRALIRVAARLSRVPRAIIYNSSVAAHQYEALGYAAERTVIIPNGFDCARFKPDAQARSQLLKQLGANPASLLVGMIARNHPMKDHVTMARAAALARERRADIHLLLVGKGMTKPSPGLAEALRQLPLERVSVKEHDCNIGELLPGLDVLALSSAWGEAFPNILGEAMACGIPCVTTDVGDSRLVVGETGIVVPPASPEQLAEALVRFADMDRGDRMALGAAARERIQALFSISGVARRYRQLFVRVIGGVEPAPQALPAASVLLPK